jgi:hypothetical protein
LVELLLLPLTEIIALRSLEGGASLRLLLTICFDEILLNPDYSSLGKELFISSLVFLSGCAAFNGRPIVIESF